MKPENHIICFCSRTWLFLIHAKDGVGTRNREQWKTSAVHGTGVAAVAKRLGRKWGEIHDQILERQ